MLVNNFIKKVMKKVILLFAAYVLFAVYSYGQINQGGLPVSFDKQKKHITSIKYTDCYNATCGCYQA